MSNPSQELQQAIEEGRTIAKERFDPKRSECSFQYFELWWVKYCFSRKIKQLNESGVDMTLPQIG